MQQDLITAASLGVVPDLPKNLAVVAKPPSVKGQIWLAGILSVGILALIMAIIMNRYLPIQEGWFSQYGRLMLDGKLPYRDFYFFAPPLPLFISEAIVKLGNRLIYLRYYGFTERCVLVATLYYVLSRRFSPVAALIGSSTSAVALLAYFTDAIFSYLYTCLLLLLFAVALLQAAYRLPELRRVFLALGGCCAAWAFFAKQSNGLFGTMAMFAAIVVLGPDVRRTLENAFWTAGGWLMGALPFVAWLVGHGIWHPFVQQVFQGAAASKGSFRTIFFGFARRFVEPLSTDTMIVLMLVAAWLAHEKVLRFRQPQAAGRSSSASLWLYASAAVLAILLPYPFRVGAVGTYRLGEATTYFARMSVWLLMLPCLWILRQRLLSLRKRKDGTPDPTVAILSIMSVAWAYGSAMSFSIEQQAVLPGMALLLALAYDWLLLRNARLMRYLVTGVSLVVIAFSVSFKYNWAFAWVGWRQSISQDNIQSHWPQLKGYRLDRPYAAMFDTILDDIATHTDTQDSVFTFPFMPMFNYITGHSQPTFGLVHYWDVCPDWLARADAQRVVAARPRIIISMELREDMWQFHEVAFRKGQPSGQRAIREAIHSLVASGDYQLLHSFKSAFYAYPVYVWWRAK